MKKNSKPRQTALRAKIKIKASGAVLTGTPSGFGMQASDGNFYNRSEYTMLKRKSGEKRVAS